MDPIRRLYWTSSQIRADGAVAVYKETLVQAVREIADVGTRQRGLTARLTQTRAALSASHRAYDLIQARYRGGLAPYFEVLSAEDALNANRRNVADLEASALALEVALVRALGGGFRHSLPEGTQRQILKRISARLEYLYSDLGVGGGTFDRHGLLAGIAYRF